MKKIIIILAILFWGFNLKAHPTSFKDSIGVMGSHDERLSHLQINYSLEYWQAIGIHNFTLDGENWANFLSYNLLLKRWNGNKFQGNVYLGNGLGYSEKNHEESMFNFIQFDIEDRRLYFLYKLSRFGSFSENEFLQHKVRLGFAPYEGGFTEVNTWIIFEYMDNDFFEEKTSDLTLAHQQFYQTWLISLKTNP